MKRKQPVYPHKTTLNLVVNERPPNYYPRIITATIVGALLIAVFCKFAVINRIAADNALWRNVNNTQQQLDSLLANNEDFDYIKGEYEKYFASSSTQKEFVDCLEVLRIIDSRLMPKSKIKSINYKDNVLNVVLTGIDMEQASRILNTLYDSEPLVKTVIFETATTSDEEESAVAMVITLNPEGGGAE